MLLQPRFHMRLVVRAVVVHYQMQRLILGKLPIQAAEKFQPFLVTVPWVAFTDHLAVQHVERRKQRRGAIAFVVVRHRAAAAFLQRQSRLRPIQRLNLALFIQTQHQRLVAG